MSESKFLITSNSRISEFFFLVTSFLQYSSERIKESLKNFSICWEKVKDENALVYSGQIIPVLNLMNSPEGHYYASSQGKSHTQVFHPSHLLDSLDWRWRSLIYSSGSSQRDYNGPALVRIMASRSFSLETQLIKVKKATGDKANVLYVFLKPSYTASRASKETSSSWDSHQARND